MPTKIRINGISQFAIPPPVIEPGDNIGKAKPGYEIYLRVYVYNSGTVKHRFTISTIIRHIATNQDFVFPLKEEYEAPKGRPGWQPFTWKVPNNAPKGDYTIICAVWEGQTEGVAFNKFDEKVFPSVFTVT